jgi:hypothetical protein
MIRPRRTIFGIVAVSAAVLTALLPATPAAATASHRSPEPRTDPAMAQDPSGGVLLFGGVGVNPLADTWLWDGSGWTQLHPAHAPSPRSQMGMAFDAARGRVVLFGGRTTSQIFGDTWTWNGTDWTEQHTAHSPPPLAGLRLAYDAVRQQVVLFGDGLTWTWNGTDWTEQHPVHQPDSRTGFGMATDPLGGVVLFGGFNGDGFLGDTWTWDGTDWNLRSPAHAPKARSDLGMAYDAAHGKVVLFGGRRLNDTWAWNGTDWTKLAPADSPNGRGFSPMATDPAGGGTLLFGPDTWTWDGTDWTQHPEVSIKINGHSGPPGSSTEVVGWGFLVSDTVKIYFVDSVHGKTLLLTLQADLVGTFTRGVTIPANATHGKQKILVKGVSSHQSAQVGYTVK